MRDDLHKSVPPRTPWARVLRLAQLPERDPELQVALVRAVRADASWLGGTWGRKLEVVLTESDGGFFVEDRVRHELLRLEETAPDHTARAVVGIALGLLARDGHLKPGFRDAVLSEALRIHGADSVEQTVSCVATRFDRRQAALVRGKLSAALDLCDLTKKPVSGRRRSAEPVDEGLGIPLPLRVR